MKPQYENKHDSNLIDSGEYGWYLISLGMLEAGLYPYGKEAPCTQILVFRTLKAHGGQMSEEELLRETGLRFGFYVCPNYDTAISKLLKRGLIEKTGHFWNRGYAIPEDVKSMVNSRVF